MLDAEESYTIDEFCKLEHISRAQFYILLNSGRGPDVFRPGAHIRITSEARKRWHKRLEREQREAARLRQAKTDS
jgi:hypothetical protein